MADGGFDDDKTPLIPETKDNDDDDDDGDTTFPFQPGGSSTPGRQDDGLEMVTMHKEKSGLPKHDKSYIEETSFGGTGRTSGRSVTTEEIERRLKELRNFNTELIGTKKAGKYEQLLSVAEKEVEIQRVKDLIKKEYPEVDFDKLGEIRFAKDLPEKSKLKLMDVVVVGTYGGQTKIIREDGTGLLEGFLGKVFVKKALGKPAATLLEEENVKIKGIGQAIKEAQKEVQMAEKTYSKLVESKQKEKDLSNKLEKERAKKEQLGSEPKNRAELARSEQLIKNYASDLKNTKKETKALEKQVKDKEKKQTRVDQLSKSFADETEKRNTMEKRLNSTKTFDELNKQKEELERQNKEDREIINDENASPSEKEAAEERVAEREEELARLAPQVEERERAMSLRERIKEIFKKYGVTVTAIVLAASVTIGAVITAITNALKSMGKALGNGLKEIGKKTASLLPGLIGSIVSFLFKTAGQAISFLAERTWLLILAVVAFLVESYVKKQR